MTRWLRNLRRKLNSRSTAEVSVHRQWPINTNAPLCYCYFWAFLHSHNDLMKIVRALAAERNEKQSPFRMIKIKSSSCFVASFFFYLFDFVHTIFHLNAFSPFLFSHRMRCARERIIIIIVPRHRHPPHHVYISFSLIPDEDDDDAFFLSFFCFYIFITFICFTGLQLAPYDLIVAFVTWLLLLLPFAFIFVFSLWLARAHCVLYWFQRWAAWIYTKNNNNNSNGRTVAEIEWKVWLSERSQYGYAARKKSERRKNEEEEEICRNEREKNEIHLPPFGEDFGYKDAHRDWKRHIQSQVFRVETTNLKQNELIYSGKWIETLKRISVYCVFSISSIRFNHRIFNRKKSVRFFSEILLKATKIKMEKRLKK